MLAVLWVVGCLLTVDAIDVQGRINIDRPKSGLAPLVMEHTWRINLQRPLRYIVVWSCWRYPDYMGDYCQ